MLQLPPETLASKAGEERPGNESQVSPPSDHQSQINQHPRQVLVNKAKAHQTISRADFRDKFASGVSLATLDCTLRNALLKKWLAKRKPLVKAEHGKKELHWAMAEQWTLTHSRLLIWHDEYSVKKSKDARQGWVLLSGGKWLVDDVRPQSKDSGMSLIVWSDFGGSTKGRLVPIPESITGTHFLSLMKQYFP